MTLAYDRLQMMKENKISEVIEAINIALVDGIEDVQRIPDIHKFVYSDGCYMFIHPIEKVVTINNDYYSEHDFYLG